MRMQCVLSLSGEIFCACLFSVLNLWFGLTLRLLSVWMTYLELKVQFKCRLLLSYQIPPAPLGPIVSVLGSLKL